MPNLILSPISRHVRIRTPVSTHEHDNIRPPITDTRSPSCTHLSRISSLSSRYTRTSHAGDTRVNSKSFSYTRTRHADDTRVNSKSFSYTRTRHVDDTRVNSKSFSTIFFNYTHIHHTIDTRVNSKSFSYTRIHHAVDTRVNSTSFRLNTQTFHSDMITSCDLALLSAVSSSTRSSYDSAVSQFITSVIRFNYKPPFSVDTRSLTHWISHIFSKAVHSTIINYIKALHTHKGCFSLTQNHSSPSTSRFNAIPDIVNEISLDKDFINDDFDDSLGL